MNKQLVSAKRLQGADKILFIAHLALGDFTYLQNCFRAFALAYPHIKIHLWVDELRRTSDSRQWGHLQKYVVYDWVNACPMFDKVYTKTYSPATLTESIHAAQAEHYPVVVSLAVMHRHRYVTLARTISPQGFVVGQKKPVRWFDIYKHLVYQKLDAFIPAYQISAQQRAGTEDITHISRIYANWFTQLFALQIPDQELLPYVDIALNWLDQADRQRQDWGFDLQKKTVFLNGFSKASLRSWSLQRIIELAIAMKAHPLWHEANLIINVVPESLDEARTLLSQQSLDHVVLFSAEENFFQLPAILSRCQLIISVETAVMHLANAVHVPVIALMRQTSPEWTPINSALSTIIKTNTLKASVEQISVAQVLQALPK